MSEKRERIVPVVVLLLCCLAFFPKTFLAGQAISPAGLLFSYSPWNVVFPEATKLGTNNIISDQFDAIASQIEYFRTCLLGGRLPLYSDRIQNGAPLLFVVKHNLLVYPLVALVIALGSAHGITAYILLQLLTGGLFFYAYMRRMGVSREAGVFGAVVFCFNSYAVQNLGFQMFLQFTLLPAALYAFELSFDRERSGLWAVLLVLFLHLMLLAGYPAATSFCYYFLAGYILCRILSRAENRWRNVLWFLSIGIVSVLLSMPAIAGSLDFFSAYDWSHRHRYWATHWSYRNLITTIVPFFYGSPFVKSFPFNWHNSAWFLGVLPLFLIIPGLLAGGKRVAHLYYAVFSVWLLAILYDVGGILDAVYQYIPVFNTTFAIHQRILLMFILAYFATWGFQVAWNMGVQKRSQITSFLASLAMLIAAAWYGWIFDAEFGLSDYAWSYLTVQLPLILVSFLLFAFLLFSKTRNRVLYSLLVFVCFADLWWMGYGYNPSLPAKYFYPSTRGIEFIKNNVGEHKLFLLGTTMLANTPLAYDIPTIAGRGFFNEREQGIYQSINRNAFHGHKTQYIFPETRETMLSSEIVDALGIKFVAARKGLSPTSLPFSLSAQPEVPLVAQKEWNAEVELRRGRKLRQTFAVPSSGSARVLRLPVARNELRSDATILLSISSENGVFETQAAVGPGAATPIEFSLEGMSFETGVDYELLIRIEQKNVGRLKLYAAEGVDVLRSGSLTGKGFSGNGDLQFFILQSNTGFEVERERQKQNHLKDFTVAYDGEFVVWENTNVFSRAWYVPEARCAVDSQVLSAIKENRAELSRVAWLHDAPDCQSLSTEPGQPHPEVDVVSIAENQQVYSLTEGTGGMLVVSDNYFPGWKVYLDGVPGKVERVNYIMRGVRVPASTSRVVFRYEPDYLKWGFACFGIGVLLLIIIPTIGVRVLGKSSG